MNAVQRIAIVGTGPAGMYACGHLLDSLDSHIQVDLFDRLPTPWGLVRAGVAPDHPEKKLIAERLFECYLQHDRVRFFGNVEIGKTLTHEELSQRYDGVIYAVGANSNQTMNIPGENLNGCWSAREFVAWYNGHPDFSELEFDLSHQRAVIVGNGNVALDVARILTTPIADLKKTDIADHALAALAQSKVKEVVMLARRGAAQAAFNNPELEELLHLHNVAVTVEGEDLKNSEASTEKITWEARRKLVTLNQLVDRHVESPDKRIVFRFLASPQEVIGTARTKQIKLNNTELVTDEHGQLKAIPLSEGDTVDTGLVFFATGYRGLALSGLPFDEARGVIPHSEGRVVNAAGSPIPRTYVTGWIKRGPKGVIGSNKQCAKQTVESLLADLHVSTGQRSTLNDDIAALLKARETNVIKREDWLKIDRHERQAGRAQGRPRIKITSTHTMCECL